MVQNNKKFNNLYNPSMGWSLPAPAMDLFKFGWIPNTIRYYSPNSSQIPQVLRVLETTSLCFFHAQSWRHTDCSILHTFGAQMTVLLWWHATSIPCSLRVWAMEDIGVQGNVYLSPLLWVARRKPNSLPPPSLAPPLVLAPKILFWQEGQVFLLFLNPLCPKPEISRKFSK